MGSELRHRKVHTNGIEMHIAEQGGSGPLVLLFHGFPELWFSWRHQMRELAKHGYHVVAPDLRGYGDTDSPPSPSSYTYFHLVGDIIGLLDHLGHHQAFVVGHDWVLGWLGTSPFSGQKKSKHLLFSEFHSFHALQLSLSNHLLKCLGKDSTFFNSSLQQTVVVDSLPKICYFKRLFLAMKPGRAEEAFARSDCYTVFKKFLLSTKPDLLIAPPGMEIIDFLDTPSSLPAWLTEEELQYYASNFQKSGFTGPLNYYRAMDLNWELLAPWQGAIVTAPTKFIVGNKDIAFESFGTKDYVEGEIFKSLVPKPEVVITDGHHFIQQEKAEDVTNEILSFFNSL